MSTSGSVELVDGVLRKGLIRPNEAPSPPFPQLALPLFGDLGKATMDIFRKGYILDKFLVSTKASSECGTLDVETSAMFNIGDGTFLKGVDVKGKCANDFGSSLTGTWNTDNVIGLEVSSVSLNPKFPDSVSLKGTIAPYCPDAGSMGFSLQLNDGSVDFAIEGRHPEKRKFKLSMVLGCEAWLAGFNMELASDPKCPTTDFGPNVSFAVAHYFRSFQAVFLCENNLSDYSCNIYKRLGNRMEMAIRFGSSYCGMERKKIFYNLGARCVINDNLSVRAKINDGGMAGLGLDFKLGPVKFVGSTVFDLKKVKVDLDGDGVVIEGNRFGLGIEIEN